LIFFMGSEVCFESFRKFAAGEHDAATTAFALQANVRAEAGYCPFIGATGMLFAEAQVIVEVEVGEHRSNW
jgi:hypothetical protein